MKEVVKNSIFELLKYGKEKLKENEIESYAIDTELFIMFATGFNKTEIFTKIEYSLTEKEFKIFEDCIFKRISGIPSQYIIGKCEFMSLNFIVNNNVLIPRCDTEILVETALDYIKKNNIKTVLDIGTGSGCIPISLCKYSDVRCTSVDINIKALEVAKENAKINSVFDRINFIESDIFQNVNEKFDMIISNPPYIPSKDIQNLMTEIKDNEPITALDGGLDGLDFYKKIVFESRNYLNNNGFIIFEIGYDQAKEVSNILKNSFKNIKVFKDLANLDRVVLGQIGENYV